MSENARVQLRASKHAVRVAAEPAAWNDWAWQLRHAMHTGEALGQVLKLSAEEDAGCKHAEAGGFALGITPYYASLMHAEDTQCPVRIQAVPVAAEQTESAGDMRDPLGEETHEVAPHLVQRYPDRVLLLVTDRCAVYCRFCTRSRMVGDGGGPVSLEKLAPAFAYLRAHPEIKDVILSGGDPLAMGTERLVSIVAALRSIESVETIRLATRVPVTLPMRITDELVAALQPFHPLWVMTHFNHAKELSPEARAACEKLANAGFPVMNQTVLLRGVNDSARALEELFRGLLRVRVRPYYLLQMDPVRGTGHLRTALRRGMELMSELQGRMSGIALPKFICDSPGGKGKVHLAHNSIVHVDGAATTLRTFRGDYVDYIDVVD